MLSIVFGRCMNEKNDTSDADYQSADQPRASGAACAPQPRILHPGKGWDSGGGRPECGRAMRNTGEAKGATPENSWRNFGEPRVDPGSEKGGWPARFVKSSFSGGGRGVGFKHDDFGEGAGQTTRTAAGKATGRLGIRGIA